MHQDKLHQKCEKKCQKCKIKNYREMRENGGNHFVPGLDYMKGGLKLPNQALRTPGESLQTCIA